MRLTVITPGEYYHIFNRGNNKQLIFLDDRDWVRFLFLIIHLQSPTAFQNIGRQVTYFVENRAFNISRQVIDGICDERLVELVNFTLMPNHFHITVYEVKEGGIAQYMQRVLCAYTKYFNKKYKKVGHLFQGPYKAVRVKDDSQLLYLSAYIHRNPREIKGWKSKEHNYPWSSFQDYVNENRWDNLMKHEIIREQFRDGKEYKIFVDESGAKESEEIFDEEFYIDLEK
jgi:putative transposase